MHTHHDHDLLEDWQADLFQRRHSHIHPDRLRGLALANIDDLSGVKIECNYLHLWDVADVLGRICHDELEVETIEGVKEVELIAVNLIIAHELELELNVAGSRGLVDGAVGLHDTATVCDLEPFALRWHELDRLLLEKGPLIVCQRC